ncbi:MAG: response regulator [Chloroflexales bacterium]|nr:response regulator [Chloroflexales bacterium]
MKTILIVEDVAVNVELLVELLEDDYALIVADNGADGLAIAARARPDLILMDMSLPVLDGYEATQRLKADPALRHIPVIGLSAHAMRGDDRRALEHGCDAYLTKPLDERLLFDLLARYLGA